MHNSNSSCEQNGRQPPLPGQASAQRPLQDSRFTNQNAGGSFGTKVDLCRDFLWGTCTKTTQCKYRHELDFEEMKKVLRFCHDHQNRSGCTREDCTYLHTTKDEENLFLTTGQLPRVLAERHTNMIAATNTAETIPQIALFIKESYVNAPPPPPPPPPPVPAPSPPFIGTSPRPPTVQQTPPPPPPPPPPAAQAMPPVVLPTMATPMPVPTSTPMTSSMAMAMSGVMPGVSAAVTPPVYTGPPPNVMYSVNLPPPNLSPMFDASRPPPPLPGSLQSIQAKNGALKRRFPSEAGPSKLRKAEDFRLEDELCANCLQQQLRIDACRNEVQQLDIEEKIQKIILQNKTDEYDNIKYMLRSLVRPEVCRILEEHVEGVPHLHLQDILAEINQAPFASSSIPSVLMLLLESLLNSSRSAAAPLRLDDALLQSMTQLTRRNTSITDQSHVIDALSGLIRNSNTTPDRVPPKIDLKMPPPTNNNGMNGYGRYNGQKVDEVTAVSRVTGNTYLSDQQVPRVVAPVPIEGPTQPGPSGYHNFPVPVPPPNRSYYTQPYTVPNNTSMPYYQNYRGMAPVYGARGTIPAVAPMNPNYKETYPYMMANRYPAPPQ